MVFSSLIFLFSYLTVTLLLYFTLLDGVHPLWLIPIGIGAFFALVLLHFVYLFVTSLFFSKQTPARHSPYRRAITILSLKMVLCLLRVRVRTRGTELLPKEPFILISNHRSIWDPVVSMVAFDNRKLAFIAKAPVMKYPIVGPHIRHCCCLGIERDKPLQSLRVVNRAAKFVKEAGMDYGIFPEGTRTKNGRVGAFKSGAFLAAKKADAPIVVMTTEGTESFRRFSPLVTLTVRSVIDVETVRAKSIEELAEESRDIIVTALGEKEEKTEA